MVTGMHQGRPGSACFLASASGPPSLGLCGVWRTEQPPRKGCAPPSPRRPCSSPLAWSPQEAPAAFWGPWSRRGAPELGGGKAQTHLFGIRPELSELAGNQRPGARSRVWEQAAKCLSRAAVLLRFRPDLFPPAVCPRRPCACLDGGRKGTVRGSHPETGEGLHSREGQGSSQPQ